MTWLDNLCRRLAEMVDPKHHGGDPRKALAYHVGDILQASQQGKHQFKDSLDETFYALLTPFISGFLPNGAELMMGETRAPPPRPLGLLLTRATANLLSATDPSNIPDTLWREALGPWRAVYVDIPHGALVLDAGVEKTDVLQLRAILAAPYLLTEHPGCTLFVAQITNRGSEQGRGRVAGVLHPDGTISHFTSPKTKGVAGDWTLRPPHAHPLAERAFLGRAGTFLRLVLAYHFFGPERAREPVTATPSHKLRDGKPRKDESFFALTRLTASDRLGRPQESIPSSWSLTSRQDVTGHFKLQAYGAQLSLRRLIWVDSYTRGPEGAPTRPEGRMV